jgi:hypothetical protein
MIFCKKISKRNIKTFFCPIFVISIFIYVTYALNYEYGLSSFNFFNKKRPHVDLNKILNSMSSPCLCRNEKIQISGNTILNNYDVDVNGTQINIKYSIDQNQFRSNIITCNPYSVLRFVLRENSFFLINNFKIF